MATHSSVLAWRISGTEEPGGLPSMGSHRVGHDWSDLAAAAVAGFSVERIEKSQLYVFAGFGHASLCHHHSEFFGNSVYVSCVFLPFIRCLLLSSPILFNLVSGPLGFFCFCAFAIIFYKMVLQPRNLTLTIPFPSHPIEIVATLYI